MRSRHVLVITLLAGGAVAAGCAAGSSDTAVTTTTGTTTTSSSHGGTGGTGGNPTGGSGGSGATGGQAPNGCTAGADHVVISEVAVAPAGGEFVEIWNRGASAVALDHYYLSDNAIYHRIAAGQPWSPILAYDPQSDFLAQFPAGATIGPGELLVIQAASGDFSATFGVCPDYVLAAAGVACGAGTVAPMVAPPNGGIGTSAGSMLSNDREMVVLFCWDGTSTTIRDVDYVTWGTEFDAETRIDKSAVAGYQADTPAANQTTAVPPGATQSIARCTANEPDEATSGGNGISGHNETSENLGAAFQLLCTPTPGENSCANTGGCGGGGG